MSAAELSALNNSTLKQLIDTVAQCARKDTVETRMQSFYEQYAADISQLEKACTPIDMSRSLQAAVKESNSRLNRLEEALSSKLERSELRHIESLVADLETFENFKDTSTKQIAALESSSSSLLSQMDAYRNQLLDVFAAVEEVTRDWQHNHAGIERTLTQLKNNFNELNEYTRESCVDNASFAEVSRFRTCLCLGA